MKKLHLTLVLTLGCLSASFAQLSYTYPVGPFATLYDGELVEADYWDTVPRILSAGVGFSDIVAIDTSLLNQNIVQQAEGAWLSDISCGIDDADFTSASLRNQVQTIYIYQNQAWQLKEGAIGLDGLPVVFSWPVLNHTVDVTDFRIILNTGDTVSPYMTGTWPNFENNERNCIVLFGEFSNRTSSSDPNARFPIKCEIIEDATPLALVGPNQKVANAVGLSWETTTNPYDPNNGPRLIGAKLNWVGNQSAGEGTSNNFINNLSGTLPNDEFALYGGGDFRLRMLTTGGFSPDGVRGLKPDDFARFFRIHAIGVDGNTLLLEKTDTVYQVRGGNLKILGLSDLGRSSTNYDDCYDEDRDNYIDIILEGDEAAARNITFLEIPSLAGGYDPLFNPGGPGSTPFQGVIYSSPGPADLEPVIMALDDPWRVSADASIPLNLEDISLNQESLTVYPNPARDWINLKTEAPFDGTFQVYQATGTLVLESDQSKINIQELEPGVYLLVKTYQNGKRQATRFIKEFF